jgi:hypothetical protein
MEVFTTAVPVWVSLAFILTFPIFFFMVANTARQSALNAGFELEKAKVIRRNVLIFSFLYLIYVSALAFTGIFKVNTLPPRVLLFTAAPLMLFLILVVRRNATFKTLWAHATLPMLIRLHTFRFVGITFLITHAYGALPKTFAYIAGIGDILTAIFAIFVANWVENQKPISKWAVLVWNCFGLFDIVNVLISAILTTRLSIETGSQSLIEIGSFPFAWIPAVAPATIIFMHLMIFKKWSVVFGEKRGIVLS